MLRICVIGLLAFGAVSAQPPQYEAASVKPSVAGNNGSSSNGSKGQVVMRNQTLKRLIERAYEVKPFQVTGPAWMEDVRFDVSAKFPVDTKLEDRPLMLRALLEERFKLAAHLETKDLPGYALVVVKKKFKLKPVDVGNGSDTSSNGGVVRTLTAQRTSMAQLADVIARDLGEMVVDRTDLAGVYNFELKYSKDDTDTSVPSLFTALEETLGVRLQSEKVPSRMVVVDRVDRVPVEN